MTIILDGKLLADKITQNLKEKTASLKLKPKLAVIIAGDNPASLIYVKNKQKRAEEIGFESIVLPMPKDVSEENLLENIYILNEMKEVNAVLVQLPLPDHINKFNVIEAIAPEKDVDCFSSRNAGKMLCGYQPYVLPCTPKGIIRLLDNYNIELEGRNVLVIGRSNIVGKPLSVMLQARNATVTVAHSKTQNLKDIALKADIIVSAAGCANLVTADFVHDGAVIVDVGINRVNGKLTGDVDFANVYPKASYITPVPGGVGPMTIAMLMENTFELYQIQNQN